MKSHKQSRRIVFPIALVIMSLGVITPGTTVLAFSPYIPWMTVGSGGINEQGQIVGQASIHTLASPHHAFLWKNGVMTDLGTLGGSTSAADAINNAGQVVGRADTSHSNPLFFGLDDIHAFLWEDGQMTDLGTLGGNWSVAYDINDAGQVVGGAKNARGKFHAFLWENGQMTDLGTLGGSWSEARAINNLGQVVGEAATADNTTHAFLWENGTMTDLGALGTDDSEATDINDAGQVVGRYWERTGDGILEAHHPRAFIWENGQMKDLGTLGGIWSQAHAINTLGQVVGTAAIASSNYNFHAFLWKDGVMMDLGVLNGEDSDAKAINDAGQVTGYAEVKLNDTHSRRHPFLWQDGQMSDLIPEGTTGPFARPESAWIEPVCLQIGILLTCGLPAAFGLLGSGRKAG